MTKVLLELIYFVNKKMNFTISSDNLIIDSKIRDNFHQ